MPKKHVIQVIVEGGVVQDVLHVPANIEVHVLDHDIEGAAPERLKPNPIDGRPCCITVYG
jgi:hypothetical protein